MRTYNLFSLTHRHKDDNGYIYVDECPILRAGTLEYLGSELIDGGDNIIDGVKLDPKKIYKVYLPVEELEKAKKSFEMLPVVDEHTWLGEEGEDAKGNQEGMTGENAYIKDNMLYVPMKFTGKGIIADLENGKEELSASYTNQLKKSDNPAYDFIATDYKGNHIALVDKGRCGAQVRVLNAGLEQEPREEQTMAKKTKNSAVLELDGKRIDLDQFFTEEEKENGIHDESISENEDEAKDVVEVEADKVESIPDAIPDTIASGDDEVKDDDEEKAENEEDEEKSENEDKRDIIRQIMAIAGKHEDNEDVRTIAKLAEKLAYEPSEASKSDNSDEEVEDKKEVENGCDVKNEEEDDEKLKKVENSLKALIEETEKTKKRAYNSARAICGDFNPFGMSADEMLVKALNSAGISVDGNETTKELEAMVKVANSFKVDPNFSYGGTAEENLDIIEL